MATVIDDNKIQISAYDQNKLRELEIASINAIQEDGSSTRQVLWDLETAFRLGFTAVGRGEAEGQEHPPLPEWMAEGYDESAAEEVEAAGETDHVDEVDETEALRASQKLEILQQYPDANAVQIDGRYYVYTDHNLDHDVYIGSGPNLDEALLEAASAAAEVRKAAEHKAARLAIYADVLESKVKNSSLSE